MKNFIIEESAMNALMIYGYPGFLSKSKQKRMKLLRLCVVDVDIFADLQVVNGVLQAKVPCNLSKKTTGRNVRKPEGSARFDPQSEEWRQIWVDQSQGQGLRRSKWRK